MLIALFAMVATQAAVFFTIPERGTTDVEFVDAHMVYALGLAWAILYASQLIYIAGDIIRLLWTVRRTLFGTFILGAILTIIGAVALMIHCCLIFVQAVKRCQEMDPTFPKITPHDLRHTAASLAISAGANVKGVQRMLGHSSAAMTLDVYADLFEDDLDEVSARLDDLRTRTLVGFS